MQEKSVPMQFEESLSELESLIEEMEKGDLSLEDSLRYFERGIQLTRACQTVLREAEQTVEKLTEQNDKTETTPFDLQQG